MNLPPPYFRNRRFSAQKAAFGQLRIAHPPR
jgi:hypothetical protein